MIYDVAATPKLLTFAIKDNAIFGKVCQKSARASLSDRLGRKVRVADEATVECYPDGSGLMRVFLFRRDPKPTDGLWMRLRRPSMTAVTHAFLGAVRVEIARDEVFSGSDPLSFPFELFQLIMR